MERREIVLNHEIKILLLNIIHAGKITPFQADDLICKIDCRGNVFSIKDIYSDYENNKGVL